MTSTAVCKNINIVEAVNGLIFTNIYIRLSMHMFAYAKYRKLKYGSICCLI